MPDVSDSRGSAPANARGIDSLREILTEVVHLQRQAVELQQRTIEAIEAIQPPNAAPVNRMEQLKDQESQAMALLLKLGPNKAAIAREMGISRVTLNRSPRFAKFRLYYNAALSTPSHGELRQWHEDDEIDLD